MPKTISMFGKFTNEGFYSGTPSGKEFKPAKKPLEVRKPIDVDATQKVTFDPDDTQRINNPHVTSPVEVPAYKAPTKLGASKAADAFLKQPLSKPPQASNSKLLMQPGGPEKVVKANLPPRKISPSAKLAEPKSPLQGLPNETLAGSPNFGGHRGFRSAFVSKTPEAEPMHKQAPPSLGNQNVRPRERKRIGEGSIINRFRGAANKAIGRENIPIRRTAPYQVDPENKETPALWRRNDALSKSQEMPRVKADAPKVPEPAPSPAPAVMGTPGYTRPPHIQAQVDADKIVTDKAAAAHIAAGNVPYPIKPKPAAPPTPGPGSSAPIANGPAPTFTSPADVKAGNTELKTAPRRPRSTGGGASSKKSVEGEPAEPTVAKPDVAAAKAEKAAEKEARAAANVATQKSKEIAAKVDDVHKGVMVAGHFAQKGAKQIFNTLNTWTKIKR